MFRRDASIIVLCLTLLISALGWAQDLASGHLSPSEHVGAAAAVEDHASAHSPSAAEPQDHHCHAVAHATGLPASEMGLSANSGASALVVFDPTLNSRQSAPPKRPPKAPTAQV